MRIELDKRYTELEELQKSRRRFDQSEVEKQLENLEKLQMKYNRIETKRKKLAKQNYEQVKSKKTIRWNIFLSLLKISKFSDAYETGLSGLKADVNERSVLSAPKEHSETLLNSNTFQGNENGKFSSKILSNWENFPTCR